MKRPYLLVQLSDFHIGGDWADADAVAGLERAVDAVLAMKARPDAVLVTGDLADHAADDEYQMVRRLLAPLGDPVLVLPGNHDRRAALRRHFAVPGAPDDPVRYAADLGPLRVIVLDTTIPDDDPGMLDADQLAWLDAELAARTDRPTIVAMHHPPLALGIPAFDEAGLAAPDRVALGEVIARHRHVRLLVGGHVHVATTGVLAGIRVMTSPSTYVQMRLAFGVEDIELAENDPAGFLVHAVVDDDIVSHLRSF